MLIKIFSVLHKGLETMKVDVEINIGNRGLPGFEIVGLPSQAVAESRERVRAAILNSGIEFPSGKIMVNLAPADVPKEGSYYDLPIAIGILSTVTQCEIPARTLFFGELSLDGSVRHTKGTLLLALFAKENGFDEVFVPKESANEAAIVSGIKVFAVSHLSEVVKHLLHQEILMPFISKVLEPEIRGTPEFDMIEVLGQEQAKRAMEIAATGGHNMMMVGSPGAGKTMLARALPGILPFLHERESLEVTKIYSAIGNISPGGSLITIRPFRSPHHTISFAGMIGGGSKPQPGEISLAHRGVLFLDEFNEFPRSILEGLRQPLEDGRVSIVRSKERVTYPAQFMLVASSNPCPCGYLGHSKKPCVCTPREVQKYQKKASGPILDRIDLHVNVPAVEIEELSQERMASRFLESSENVRKRVERAREIQQKRFEKESIHTNAEMKNHHVKKYCVLTSEVEHILSQAAMTFRLSARSYFKMIKIARTIADLEGSLEIAPSHMAETLQYRQKIYDEV